MLSAKRSVCLILAILSIALIASGCRNNKEPSNSSGSSSGGSTSETTGKAGVNKNEVDNPMNDAADPTANSGTKGEFYYISWGGIVSSLMGDSVAQYDALGFTAALQGVMNRDDIKVYLDWQSDTDRFWYKYLRREDKMLHGYKQINIMNLNDFFSTFGGFIKEKGLVAWDSNVPATSNVAITVCGVDDTLPVRAGGSFTEKLINATGAQVKLDLNDKFTGKGTIWNSSLKSSGSAKCDAYLWALEKYGNKTSKTVMGYILDGTPWNDKGDYPDLGNAFVPNRDYLISNRAFVFDLSPWDDEAPCDDLNQPLGTDFNTMKKILKAQYDKAGGNIFQVVGFVPWQQKYTQYLNKSKHEEVSTEWWYAEIISSYNGIMDADAAGYCGMSNASLYRHYQLKETYENAKPSEKLEYNPRKKYVMIFMGDYDSAAWMKTMIPKVWTDGYRGTDSFNWAFNPNLSDRVPMVFDYIRETATSGDFFMTGASGAGYLNPSLVLDRPISGLPSGEDKWVNHNLKYFKKFDLDFTGFVINGDEPLSNAVVDMYAKFSPLGFLHNDHKMTAQLKKGAFMTKILSDFPRKDNDAFSAEESAGFLVNKTMIRESYPFYAFRAILWKPEQVKQVMDLARKNSNDQIVFCDYKTFVDLANQAMSQ